MLCDAYHCSTSENITGDYRIVTNVRDVNSLITYSFDFINLRLTLHAYCNTENK